MLTNSGYLYELKMHNTDDASQRLFNPLSCGWIDFSLKQTYPKRGHRDRNTGI
jgi:hypothetical protein